MIKCVCGKSLKSETGFRQHGKSCLKYQKDVLSGGSGHPPVPDSIDVARDQLRNEILPTAITTLRECLSGTPMKESIIRAAIAVIKLTGADKPSLKKDSDVVVSFGEDPESLFDPKDEKDEEASDDSDMPQSTSLAV